MTVASLKQRVTRRYPAIYARFRGFRGGLRSRRHGLSRPGVGSVVATSAHIHPDSQLDDYAYVGIECHISVPVTIGRYSMLAPRVAVVGADHAYQEPGTPTIFAGRADLPVTVIGSDVWIGYGVIILAGTTIGDGTIVGAGSVVTADLPAMSICVGNPARVVRQRFADDEARAHHRRVLDGPTVSGRFADPR